ncbi:MAG: efflux RND transporter permease subunit [Kineosporiaceae bacterium]
MTAFVRLCLRNRALTLIHVGVLLAAGWVSADRLKQELFPPLDAPFVSVIATQPGAGASAVAEDIVAPVEDALEGAEGLQSLTSTARDSAATFVLEYDFGDDTDERLRQVQDRLADVSLPDGADLRVETLAPGGDAAYGVSVFGEDEAEISAYVEDTLRPALEAVDGVGDVEVTGGVARQVVVELDPDALADAGLGVSDVSSALESANRSFAVGSVVADRTDLPVTVTDGTATVAEIEAVEVSRSGPAGTPGGAQVGAAGGGAQVPDASSPGPGVAGSDPASGADPAGTSPTAVAAPEPPTIGELGTVTLTDAGDGQTISRTNGEPAVTLEVIAEQDADIVDLVGDAVEAVEANPPPSGASVTEVVNQEPEITSNINALVRDALLGVGVLVVLLLLFLRRIGPTLVAGVSIPTSIAVALGLMYVQEISLNIITIGALLVAAARVIDDAIVVLENIYRLLESGMHRTEAVVQGTRQVIPAITSSTVATASVFLPLVFVGGLVGQIFLGFALTVVYALTASLVVAVTVVPVLAHLLLRPRPAGHRTLPGDRPLVRAYTRPLQWVLGHRWITVAAAVALLAASLSTLTRIPTTLFPETVPTALEVTVTTPPGQSLAITSDQLVGLEEEVAGLDGVERYTSSIGSRPEGFAALGGGDAAGARVTVTLAEDADVDDLAGDLEAALAERDLEGTVVPTGTTAPDSSGASIEVRGADFDAVQEGARLVADELGGIDGLADVQSTVDSDRTELVVDLDAAALADAGLSGDAVTAAVRSAVNGATVEGVVVDAEASDVSLALPAEATAGGDALGALAIADGVVLSDVATVSEISAPSTVTSSDGQRTATVTGTITDENTGAVNGEITAAVDGLGLPDGVEASVGGATQNQQESFGGLFQAMGFAVILVYLVLVATFGSLVTPLVILLSLPLAAVGALPALLLSGWPLDLSAMIGMLMLIGIVVTNAIVLLDFVERRRREGVAVGEALVLGGQARLRPIIMTAAVTVGALSPLALGLSEGALLSVGLATVVIGGLVSSTLLTLFVVPAVYSLVASGGRRRHVHAAPVVPEGAAVGEAPLVASGVAGTTGRAGATPDGATR